ncbi:hypothetical protein EYF80_017235 [Liparis tanakae]|uniref:Uncharacterized protein n=1 Tax=Liparis tanakae TaxID=230148 RepID=A0A4Z2I318_9TELE|nr:hypothetical protein EYF80_017235 [Liparis tanakae]
MKILAEDYEGKGKLRGTASLPVRCSTAPGPLAEVEAGGQRSAVSWRRLPVTYVPSSRVFFYTMSSGSAQDVAVEHFLRDIERRSKRLHCAVIGCEEERPRSDMNLLYRKSRLDWRQRDQEGSKKRSVVRLFLTRGLCCKRRSTARQHQASGGVGRHVGQPNMMSDESRAELCQSSRGEKQDMPSDDEEQSRVRG